jgi:hypothetical protein
MLHWQDEPENFMNIARTLMFLAALTSSIASGAGLFEREVVFSEADIQSALAKAKPLQLSYGGLVSVALKEPPTVLLDGNDGRARIMTGVDVELQGSKPVRVDVSGRAGVRYDDKSKAFYLENPVVDSVSTPALRKEANPAVREAASQLIAAYFRTKPVYVLREDGSPQEIAARWLLKSVRIEPGRVVAVLSPV